MGDTLLRRELTGATLKVARAVTIAFAGFEIIIYLRWLSRWLPDQANAASTAAKLHGGNFPLTEVASAAAAVAIIAALPWFALSVLVFVRRSHDLFGLLLVASFLSFGVLLTDVGGIIEMERSDLWAPWPLIALFAAQALSLPWGYLFPDGRFVPRWTIVLAATWVGWTFVHIVGWLPIGQPTVGLVLLVASAGLSLVYRYWRRSTAVQQQQIKWFLLGALFFIATLLVLVPTGFVAPRLAHSSSEFLFQRVESSLLSLAVVAIPIALGIAIFGQGLLDIDLLISRTLTYVAITAILALGFAVISGVSNQVLAAITGRRSEFVLLASVVPIALAFMPVRARLFKLADRFVSDEKVMTLLFLDIVSSTERAYALGDRSWRELLMRFRSGVRHCLKRYGGREIHTTGDGFLATFARPDQALRCAHDIIESVRLLDLQVRIGVHIGAVQVVGRDIAGAEVHAAARVMSAAGPGEVLVSGAVRDVLAGSNTELKDLGMRQLKGVPGDVHLYAAFA